MMDNKQETKAVKAALKTAGIHARVSHGRGTAYGWLEINLGDPAQRNGTEPHPSGTRTRYTEAEHALHTKAAEIVREVTGRHGAYGGEILILAQEV